MMMMPEDRKYKTLDMPRHRRNQQQQQQQCHQDDYNTNSLERGMLRRRLPDIPPSRSLPRPGKHASSSSNGKTSREQSDSRSRDRQNEQKRSQSHGDELLVRF
jgi:hypothetical protein